MVHIIYYKAARVVSEKKKKNFGSHQSSSCELLLEPSSISTHKKREIVFLAKYQSILSIKHSSSASAAGSFLNQLYAEKGTWNRSITLENVPTNSSSLIDDELTEPVQAVPGSGSYSLAQTKTWWWLPIQLDNTNIASQYISNTAYTTHSTSSFYTKHTLLQKISWT